MNTLRTLLLTATLLLGVAWNADAQRIHKFGISASYTKTSQKLVNIDGTLPGYKKDALPSFSAFLFVENYLNRNFSFRSQLGYQGMGYAPTFLADANAPYSFQEGVRIHEIAADLSLKAYLGGYKLRPYLLGGMRGGTAVAIDILEPNAASDYSFPETRADHFKNASLSALAGFGFEWDQVFTIETELNLGLTPSFNYPSIKGYHRAISLRVGYSFTRPTPCVSKHKGLKSLY